MFERRVALYPAGVDQDNQLYTDTYLGDLPQYGAGHRKEGLVVMFHNPAEAK